MGRLHWWCSCRSFQLAHRRPPPCACSSATPWPICMAKEGPRFQQHRHGAHHAAHVDELPAAHLRLDVHFGEHRPAEPALHDGIIGLGTSSTAASTASALNSTAPWVTQHRPYTAMTYFPMINTQGAVVLGMVYNYLPFMILPIYSVHRQAGQLPAGGCPGPGRRLRPASSGR